MSKRKVVEEKDNKENEPTEPFKVPFIYRIPIGVKATFINYWLCGVVYFFVNMGLTNVLFGTDNIDSMREFWTLVIFDGAIYGLLYFFFGGFLIEAVEKTPGEANPWVICHYRKVWALWIDLAYGILWAMVSNYVCAYLIVLLRNVESLYWMFREPFTFAVIGLIISYLFIGVKDLIVLLYKKATHREA